MKITVTLASIEYIKADLRAALPTAGSCHRVEALARGLGWNTYAAMLATVSRNQVECEVKPGAFVAYMTAKGVQAAEDLLFKTACRIQVRTVMAAQEQLTRFGFGVYEGHRLPVPEWRIRLAEERASMLSDEGIAEFIRARDYLALLATIKTVNRKHTSYGLKHAAERHHRRGAYANQTAKAYVSNGMLIAAAYQLGLRVSRASWSSPNAHFNVSSRSVRTLDSTLKPLPQPEPGQHFLVVGHNSGRYFYLPAGARQLVALRPTEHIPSRLVALAPIEYWTSLFPPRDRRAPFDTQRAACFLFSEAGKAGIFDPGR